MTSENPLIGPCSGITVRCLSFDYLFLSRGWYIQFDVKKLFSIAFAMSYCLIGFMILLVIIISLFVIIHKKLFYRLSSGTEFSTKDLDALTYFPSVCITRLANCLHLSQRSTLAILIV